LRFTATVTIEATVRAETGCEGTTDRGTVGTVSVSVDEDWQRLSRHSVSRHGVSGRR
jgi:hypothetical protein